jgi:hypothetical protein
MEVHAVVVPVAGAAPPDPPSTISIVDARTVELPSGGYLRFDSVTQAPPDDALGYRATLSAVDAVMHALVSGSNACLLVAGEHEPAKASAFHASAQLSVDMVFELITHAAIAFPHEHVSYTVHASAYTLGADDDERIVDALAAAAASEQSSFGARQLLAPHRVRIVGDPAAVLGGVGGGGSSSPVGRRRGGGDSDSTGPLPPSASSGALLPPTLASGITG